MNVVGFDSSLFTHHIDDERRLTHHSSSRFTSLSPSGGKNNQFARETSRSNVGRGSAGDCDLYLLRGDERQ